MLLGEILKKFDLFHGGTALTFPKGLKAPPNIVFPVFWGDSIDIPLGVSAIKLRGYIHILP